MLRTFFPLFRFAQIQLLLLLQQNTFKPSYLTCQRIHSGHAEMLQLLLWRDNVGKGECHCRSEAILFQLSSNQWSLGCIEFPA